MMSQASNKVASFSFISTFCPGGICSVSKYNLLPSAEKAISTFSIGYSPMFWTTSKVTPYCLSSKLSDKDQIYTSVPGNRLGNEKGFLLYSSLCGSVMANTENSPLQRKRHKQIIPIRRNHRIFIVPLPMCSSIIKRRKTLMQGELGE